MQVFSEPEMMQSSPPVSCTKFLVLNLKFSQKLILILQLARRDSYEASQHGDNTYATIQPRNVSQMGEIADYATLRNNSQPPSVSFICD